MCKLWKVENASKEEQKNRRSEVYEIMRNRYREKLIITTNGRKLEVNPKEGMHLSRTPLWLAEAFIQGDYNDKSIVNELILNADLDYPCIFSATSAIVFLCCHKEHLREETIQVLEEFILNNLAAWMTKDVGFVGANDNYPMGCCTILAMAGEYFKNDYLLEFAKERLKDLNERLNYRGYIHECNSPTYSSITLEDVSCIVEYVNDFEVREMAERIEKRVWQELLLHTHPRLKHQVGPFSRAYVDDNAGQGSLYTFSMYAAFGKVSPYNPLDMLVIQRIEGTVAHNSWEFQDYSLIKIMSSTYHPPLKLAEYCFNSKELPFFIEGSNEFFGISNSPGGQTNVRTYMEEKWAMGCFASRTWQGQTTPLHIIYERSNRRSNSLEDYMHSYRSIYTRMTIKDTPDIQRKELIKELENDQGAAFTVSDRNVAILGYVPSTLMTQNIKSIRTSMVFPCYHSYPDEIWLGNNIIIGSMASNQIDWWFIREGEVYIGIYPLMSQRDADTLCNMKCIQEQGYCLLSWYNKLSFHSMQANSDEIRSYGSGMIVEIGTKEHYGTFEVFMSELQKTKISDTTYNTEREIQYSRGNKHLELMYDYKMLNLRRALVKDKLLSDTLKLVTSPHVEALLD